MLDSKEANGYWSPGIFLNAISDSPEDSHSLTSRAAFWAGGINVLERGEPLLIPSRSINEFSTAFTKAACIQAMHQHDSTDAPISTPVTPAMLKLLIKGAPAALKHFLIAKRDEIHRNLSFNELINLIQAIKESKSRVDEEEDETGCREVPIWAILMHKTINYMREMGSDGME